MNVIALVLGIIIVIGIAASIWWYYPFVRKPWGPTYDLERRVRKVCEQEGAVYPPESPRVVIRKAKRELVLYDGDKPLKTYKVGLGTDPVADKRREGDGCTPEGDFNICTKNDRSRFHLFLGISYPNAEDAERGRKTNLISEAEYRDIVEAVNSKRRPPWDTRLGGEIGIHGNGAGSDWTLGCIALSNEDIEELFMLLDLGTPVTINHE
jgi:murein L,D-transpeptidase YafK